MNLGIKGCQLIRNYMRDATHHKPFGLGLTAVNEVRRRIVFIFDNIMFSYTNGYTMYCV